MYADMVFTLGNRPEWQKDCGVNLPPHGGILGTQRNELIPVSKDFVTVVGATGQQEKVFFLKPLNFKDLHPVVANPYTLLTKLQESQNLFAFEWESPTTESSDGATASNLPWIRAIWRTTRIRNGTKRSHLQNPPPSNGKGTQDLLGNDRPQPWAYLTLLNPSGCFQLDEVSKGWPGCLRAVAAVVLPDLKEEPLEDAQDSGFMDGSSFVRQGPWNWQKGNIWTDSKYAFGVVHAHGAIWKERGLLTAQGKQIKHAEEILYLSEAV
ncbi:hypothetical protein QYF61_008820 [Mycteria americana]|uniref:RNase H type-1 domain-containing protein n=1 Tax=Mycteria americana TaxID=33587 RepID=A0AAN7NHH4_MYCAM|nr:hypothetical protein QYF61_008820 [Mycteria americana]